MTVMFRPPSISPASFRHSESQRCYSRSRRPSSHRAYSKDHRQSSFSSSLVSPSCRPLVRPHHPPSHPFPRATHISSYLPTRNPSNPALDSYSPPSPPRPIPCFEHRPELVIRPKKYHSWPPKKIRTDEATSEAREAVIAHNNSKEQPIHSSGHQTVSMLPGKSRRKYSHYNGSGRQGNDVWKERIRGGVNYSYLGEQMLWGDLHLRAR